MQGKSKWSTAWFYYISTAISRKKPTVGNFKTIDKEIYSILIS